MSVDKEASFVTVSQVNGYLKTVIEGIADFRHLTVKGEISNFKRYSNAAYFDLKDDKSVLPCVMLKTGEVTDVKAFANGFASVILGSTFDDSFFLS